MLLAFDFTAFKFVRDFTFHFKKLDLHTEQHNMLVTIVIMGYIVIKYVCVVCIYI